MSMEPIVLATANPHKVEELRAIFAGDGLAIVGLSELPGFPFPEPDETGATFEHNAAIKARAYALLTGRLCLADDSGIEVGVLSGAPGVISSHYSTDGRETGLTRDQRDQANNERLLRELDGVLPEQRTARFVCSMVLCRSVGKSTTEILATTSGEFQGRIGLPGDVPRGENGFGYDPLFLVPPQFNATSAQLSPERKNQLSHRAVAARAMAERIKVLLEQAAPH
ncbi:MAG: non-canonical purine NTP pyrophosphatase [Planctomycetes bacterium]|nr:non-canonical purine NTP pyrophosphatase [Planctomycetota bacterium]